MSYHSETPSQDRTSDEWFDDTPERTAAFNAAAARHLAAFPPADLVDLVADFHAVDLQRMLAGLRAGDATAVGTMLVEAFTAKVSELAAWSVAE